MTKPTEKQAKEAVKLLLKYIGEDVTRCGLKDTPARVVKSYDEIFKGYSLEAKDILNKKFPYRTCDNQIILKRIKYISICEHHILPFSGYVDIAYIPNGFIVGISKIVRLVDMFAKRLQIQENMTADIANAIQTCLKPQGVVVKTLGWHTCMMARGVKNSGPLESIHFTGVYSDSLKRSEFLNCVTST